MQIESHDCTAFPAFPPSRRRCALLLLGALLALPLAPARAAPPPGGRPGGSTSSLCRIEATQMAFGTYNSRAASAQDITATITVACVALGPRASAVSFTVTPLESAATGRGMRNGGRQMRYQLYVDAARTRPWGDGTAGTTALQGSGTVAPSVPLRASFTLYGRVLARQQLQAGSYVDTIPLQLRW